MNCPTNNQQEDYRLYYWTGENLWEPSCCLTEILSPEEIKRTDQKFLKKVLNWLTPDVFFAFMFLPLELKMTNLIDGSTSFWKRASFATICITLK